MDLICGAMTKQQIRQRLLNDLADVEALFDGAEAWAEETATLLAFLMDKYGTSMFEANYRFLFERKMWSIVNDIIPMK